MLKDLKTEEERERKAKLSINPNKIFIELCSAYRNRKESVFLHFIRRYFVENTQQKIGY